jgi:CO dehydrogenase maturation factor
VTHLLLVTDPSRKGVQVIETIHRVADELVMYEKCGAIINRVTDPALLEHVQVQGAEVLTCIPSDGEQTKNDILGQSVFTLPEKSPLLTGTREALRKIGLIS